MSGIKADCGCVSKKAFHYNSSRPVHTTWRGMIKRCTRPSYEYYHRYGGRGITVCDKWLESFEAFEAWALDNGYAKGLQLDRVNNDGNYTPENCRFVTSKVNNNNKSNNTHVWLDGQVLTAAEASRQLGHTRTYVSHLIRDGNNPYFPRLILNPPKA
jgi:hypothetical protein